MPGAERSHYCFLWVYSSRTTLFETERKIGQASCKSKAAGKMGMGKREDWNGGERERGQRVIPSRKQAVSAMESAGSYRGKDGGSS